MASNTNQLNPAPNSNSAPMQNPVPLTEAPFHAEITDEGLPPPKPDLHISMSSLEGVGLTWNMALLNHHAEIATYRIFFRMESDILNQCDSLWRYLGDVPAVPLPMTCILDRFADNQRYHFTVRAADVHNRLGELSDPVSILFKTESIAEKK